MFTDHKPLIGAIASDGDRSPRQTRHLSFVAEYSTDIRHVSGSANVVADTLSRPPTASLVESDLPDALVQPDLTPRLCSLRLCPGIDFVALAAAQGASPPSPGTSLVPVLLPVPGSTAKLWCDVSQGPPRPIVPSTSVQLVFDCIHGVSHAGGRATLREISRRFVWPGMRSDVLRLARTCLDCTASKTTRHVHSPLVRRPVPDARFSSLHLDLVGPLPQSEGFTYLMTIMDRSTRWLEAVPLTNMTAATCASALVRHWIARFGVPADVTTDQGRQFTSSLWAELHRLLGISSLRTTAYHPQANGLVERVHRVIKERLCARGGSTNWMDHLPMVLLGIRTSVREDTGLCPAELVYGTALHLPGEFLSPPDPDTPPPSTAFVDQLRRVLAAHRPPQAVHHRPLGPSPAIPRSLLDVTHVFVRVDAVRRPLTRPYVGPYSVISKTPKTFVLSKAGVPWTVSVNRLKPALGVLSPDVPPRPPRLRSGVGVPPVAVSPPAAVPPPATIPPTVPPTPEFPRAAPVGNSSSASAAPGARGVPLSSSVDTYASVLRSGRVSRPPQRFLNS